MAHKEEYGVEDTRITLLEGVYYIASGAVPGNDGTLKPYWGGADKVMCAGTGVLDERRRLPDLVPPAAVRCLGCRRRRGQGQKHRLSLHFALRRAISICYTAWRCTSRRQHAFGWDPCGCTLEAVGCVACG